jgi:hypothetical protein
MTVRIANADAAAFRASTTLERRFVAAWLARSLRALQRGEAIMRLLPKMRLRPGLSPTLLVAVAAGAPSRAGWITGDVVIPVAAAWGGWAVPPGRYTLVVPPWAARGMVNVQGAGHDAVIFAASAEDRPRSRTSTLTLASDGTTYHVRSLEVGNPGIIYRFDDATSSSRSRDGIRRHGDFTATEPSLQGPCDAANSPSRVPPKDRDKETRMFWNGPTKLKGRWALAAAMVGALTVANPSFGSVPGAVVAKLPAHVVPTPFKVVVDPVAAPCHPNPHAARDIATLASRDDVRFLPTALKQQLLRLAGRPHSTLPIQAFAEADRPSQLFQYYLLDTHGFEQNVFTSIIPGVNDAVMLTATGADCGLPTIGSVRLVVEPKPDLPTDPSDVRAFIDVFTDIHPLFVINNESGWYEGWMIHDLTVPPVAPARADGHAQFGKLLQQDADLLKAMGTGNNVPGHLFTTDGKSARFPSEADRFPDIQSNLAPIFLSMGAYNAMQQSDVHSYWEFNYTTNWVFPLYEIPFTGGIPGTFELGDIGRRSSVVPGSGPQGVRNNPVVYGDSPFLPRDPDKFDGDDDGQREFRDRFIPSGLANEIYLDVYERLASFEPGVDFEQRLFDAYAAEVDRVDQNGDGVISSVEGDVDSASDGFADNARLFLPATSYDRFAVTREINDGMLAPRFSPSQRAWILLGVASAVTPAVPASDGRDSDDR